MKLNHLFIPLALIAVAALAIGVYQANSAPFLIMSESGECFTEN